MLSLNFLVLAEQGTYLGTHEEKELYNLCKRGQVSKDGYSAVVTMCREKTQKPKAQS